MARSHGPSGLRIILPAIVVAELYAGVKGQTELAALDRFVGLFRIVPISPRIGRAGGLYSGDYTKSHGLGLAGAIVAATVVAEDAELKTLNVTHYPMFEGLKPAYRKATNDQQAFQKKPMIKHMSISETKKRMTSLPLKEFRSIRAAGHAVGEIHVKEYLADLVKEAQTASHATLFVREYPALTHPRDRYDSSSGSTTLLPMRSSP